MNWFKRLFGFGLRRPSARATTALSAEDRAKMLAEIDERVSREVAAAFRSEEEIITGVIEYFTGTYEPEAIRPWVIDRTRHFFAEHRAAERAWPETTDCDRLERAFAELEGRGIVCRQDFTCCGTCGHYEIGDEIESTRAQGALVRGYAFYHMQDTESAVVGGGVYLAYGATTEGPLAAARIAHEMCEALRAEGLAVEWDGTVEKRVFVKLDWKRRRKPVCVKPS